MSRELERIIARTLEKGTDAVRSAGFNRWEFELRNGRRLGGHARWQEGWLHFLVPLPVAGDEEWPWTLVQRNGALRGLARYVRHPKLHSGIAAEVFLPAAASEESITGALAAIREAVRGPHEKPPSPATPETRGGDSDPDWPALAAEHGWTLVARDEGRLAVELDAPGVMNQGFLELRDERAILSLALLRTAGLPPESRRAIALFLLSLTARLHGTRAALAGDEAGTVRLEVVLPDRARASALELDLALEALSLGARLASREVRALATETLAGSYLAFTLKE